VILVCRLLAAGALTVEQVAAAAIPISSSGSARAAVPTPERMNGHASALPAPLRVAPTPEPRAKAASAITAVFTLTPNACRWPLGDPQRPGFRFCGSPVTEGSYCKHHRGMAYTASRARHQPFIFAKKLKAELKEEEFV
jgi:GcrA cell cycle regulator